MSDKRGVLLLIATLLVLGQAEAVAADAGDVIAGLLGGVAGIIAICAFLGWWSRRQGGGSAGLTDQGDGV